jgi:choline dehydrogenase-like flavoprotein
VQFTTGLSAAAVPFTTAAEHKQAMADLGRMGSFIGLVRDRGHGRVALDVRGQAQVTYAVAAQDQATMAAAVAGQVRVHVAAGARRVGVLAAGSPMWRTGDDVDAFLASLERIPMRAGGYKLFSAHQMGSCRMGTDPATSVADPQGQLHDTPGVWIGDASAFPTPPGTNPMITIMALASRTAQHIIEAAGGAGGAAQQAGRGAGTNRQEVTA